MAKSIEATRTILAEDRGGLFRFVIPDGCRMTFGQILPEAKREMNTDGGEYDPGLRVYRGTDVLAVFRGVKWFRDDTIKVERRAVNVDAKTATKDVAAEWVDVGDKF